MKIVMGSKSDIKLRALKEALNDLEIDYTLDSFKVSSDVSDNPLNDETIKGAMNRNNNLKKETNDYDILISIEAGFTNEDNNYYLDTYCALEYEKNTYIGMSPRVPISKTVYEYVKDGNVLHLLVQKLQNTETNEGVIGYLSNGKLTRTRVEKIAIMDALKKALNINKEIDSIDINSFIDENRVKTLDDAIINDGDQNV